MCACLQDWCPVQVVYGCAVVCCKCTQLEKQVDREMSIFLLQHVLLSFHHVIRSIVLLCQRGASLWATLIFSVRLSKCTF